MERAALIDGRSVGAIRKWQGSERSSVNAILLHRMHLHLALHTVVDEIKTEELEGLSYVLRYIAQSVCHSAGKAATSLYVDHLL